MKINNLDNFFKVNDKGELVDFHQKHFYYKEFTPILYALGLNKYQNFNITEEQWDYLFKNSNIKDMDSSQKSVLIYAFRYLHSQDLNLSVEQWNFLLKNSDLKHEDDVGKSALHYALEYNFKKEINLGYDNWDYLIKNSNIDTINEKFLYGQLKKIQNELLNRSIENNIKSTNNIKKIKI